MRPTLSTVLLVAAIVPFAVHADPTGEEVRVYTNADLDALEPLPATVPAMPSETTPEEDWEFVQAFIERQHGRLDAERERELERERIEIERLRAEPEPRYTLPWNFLPVGLRPCNGLGSLRCRPLDEPRVDSPDRSVRPRPARPRVTRPAPTTRPGNPLPEMVPQTARGTLPAND